SCFLFKKGTSMGPFKSDDTISKTRCGFVCRSLGNGCRRVFPCAQDSQKGGVSSVILMPFVDDVAC
ncbi:hypothetical protein BVRB_041320, partial [Beta vulgaris subsp. vulgaris]